MFVQLRIVNWKAGQGRLSFEVLSSVYAQEKFIICITLECNYTSYTA
jgi:hypothetical protein